MTKTNTYLSVRKINDRWVIVTVSGTEVGGLVLVEMLAPVTVYDGRTFRTRDKARAAMMATAKEVGMSFV